MLNEHMIYCHSGLVYSRALDFADASTQVEVKENVTLHWPIR